jgi:peptidyl-prolyl cis-trans isomerase C
MTTRRTLWGGLLLAALLGACADSQSDEGLVARVGDYTLSVEDVAGLLVNEERFPAEVGVVEQVADLWVEYVMLAASIAEDTLLSDVDFEPLVLQQLEPLMILALRDSTLQVDTMVTDAELRAQYESDDPALEIRVRHILLPYPPNATNADLNALRSQAEALRARVLNGESFETLARQFSGDPGTASLGGDLGFFGRGDMLPEFEAAALALQPGQISDPVETQFGLHLIKLEELRTQGFDEIAADFRARVLAERYLAAESTLVADIETGASIQVVEGAYAVAREIAANPGSRLSGRAANRALYEYTDGELTVGELQGVLQSQVRDFRTQVVEGDDIQLDLFLKSLVQRELLVAEARASNLGPSTERMDSLVSGARDQLIGAADVLGLVRLDRAPGEDLTPAVERAAVDAVERVVTGITEMVQLGAIGFQLRRGLNPTVFARGLGQAVLRLGQLRANRSPSLLEEAFDSAGRNP